MSTTGPGSEHDDGEELGDDDDAADSQGTRRVGEARTSEVQHTEKSGL